MRGWWSSVVEERMKLASDNLEASSLKTQLAANLPWMAVVVTGLGISYSAGQHQVIRGGYLLTFSYADTLFQFYNVCRQIALVLLATIAVVLALLAFVLIFGYLKLLAERVYSPIVFAVKHRLQSEKISRNLDEIEISTVSLAYSRDPNAERMEQLREFYISVRRSQRSLATLKGSQLGIITSIDNLLLLRPSMGPADERFTTQYAAQWWRENRHSRRYLVPYLFVTTPTLFIIAVVVSLKTDTVFASWFLAAASYALFLLITCISIRMKTPETTPTASDRAAGIVITAVLLATFMFLLGRDDVQAAISSENTYCVSFQNDSVRCGKYAASNSSVVVIFGANGESGFTVIPWRSIKSANYRSTKVEDAE